jgi:MiaB/RimO family radical SAM methylthiotransferase
MVAAKFKVERDEKICLVDLQDSKCEISNYHFAQVKRFLEVNDYAITPDVNEADVVIINTCVVLDPMVDRNEAYVTSLVLRRGPAKKIVVTGCLPGITDRFSETPGVVLIKPGELDRFSAYFECDVPMENVETVHKIDFARQPLQPQMTGHDTYVLISQGCVNHCSYCNIKLVKGHVKSRPISEIEDEVSHLVKMRRYEITLLSDDCGSYGYDTATNIAELILALLNIDERLKIKIFTIFPGLFLKHYPQLKQPLLDGRITYLCVPLQTASPRILKLMNRNYDLDKIKAILEEIKDHNPDIHLFTHFIFNFPTETLQEFEKSIELAELFDHCYFIPYSDNKRTRASKITPKCSQEELDIKIELIESRNIPCPSLESWKSKA